MDDLLEPYPEIDRIDMLKLGVINSTPLMIQYLKNKPKVQKQLDASMSRQDYMDICRHGTEESIKTFDRIDFTKVKDDEGNTCMHEASRYGNLSVLRYLSRQRQSNFNALNNYH
jgi:ankyrin repeat protein